MAWEQQLACFGVLLAGCSRGSGMSLWKIFVPCDRAHSSFTWGVCATVRQTQVLKLWVALTRPRKTWGRWDGWGRSPRFHFHWWKMLYLTPLFFCFFFKEEKIIFAPGQWMEFIFYFSSFQTKKNEFRFSLIKCFTDQISILLFKNAA